MKTRDLAKLCVFLVGVFRLPAVLDYLAVLPAALPEEPHWWLDAWALFIVPTAELLLILSFIVVPGWWARLVFPRSEEMLLVGVSGERISEILFALVGLAVLVTAVPQSVEEFVRWQQTPALSVTTEQRLQDLREALPGRAALIAKVALGLMLLLGRRGVAAVWQAARQAGRARDAA